MTKKSTDASTEVQRVTTATLTDEQRRLIERAEERLRGRGSEDAVAANGLLEVLIAHPARAAADGASAVIAELASMTRMFHAACHDLGLINEALGLDPDDGGAAPILAAIGELKTRTVSPVEQHEAAPADVTLPYENALHELIRKIMPDLDSGDILADAQTAISAVACRTMTDAQIDATWANLDARGSSLYEPHQWEVEMRRRFARAIIAATPAPAQTEPPAADERATLSLNPLQLRWIKDNVRDAYDTGYNDARRNSAVSGDSAPGYRGREIEKAKGDELAAALERAARASSPNAADERAAEAREDHECVYENGDGICRECAELAKRPKPFGYARAIDYRITGQEPEDHELCSADAPGAFAIYRASSPNAAGAPSGATPAGYVLVPIEPTPEMCLAMREAVGAGWEDSLVWAGGVAAAPQPPAPASAPDEEAFVVKRLSESLADVYTTLIGDDKVDVDDNLNAIQRVERAAQVLRLELELYRAQASAPVVLTDSARDVLAERRRQIEREGWTPARDDQYRDHELSCAAGCYAMYTLAYPAGDPPPAWPWAADWWKPTTHRRNLVKAGALILAEIERLDRSAARPQGSQS
ncbi:hypothetical protein NX868_17365 [Burkholderia thailandensis]|nr:hypothetical protein [Burkholderia thailandensis]MCS3393155.1 hypothetical protein [Burkholderia thailandensis]MCS6426271.1 hypothetical protein [Burkholderia thailandensis]MCS6456490.1 hypothetical protein [Burkholderia thailandensis]MCS6465405.1 hypothetical protein [Burkholderia thailandensis]MCS6484038.1 hypothetical protein [Burkholderia thailandensis]